MTKAYFISDLHLGATESAEENKKQEIITTFLKSIMGKASHLYMVGDIFDFWFEYHYVIPKKYFKFLHLLQLLRDAGTQIVYLAGNHDFYLGNFFKETMGIQTYNDSYSFSLDGKKFCLFHGDGVAKKDVGYRILKKILRNKTNIKLYRLLHPDFGIPFARFVSGSSRKYTNQIVLRDEGDYIEYAEKRFNEGVDYVMMGHRHNPIEHQVGSKKYINLGDWIVKYSYALFDGSGLYLKFFNHDQE